MYTAKEIEKIDNGAGYWNSILVGVFKGDEKVGEYKRNYSTLYDTFFAFPQGDKWYALYSPNYTCTRIMSLPDCKDIGGEEPCGYGFCPVELYVPYADPDLTDAHPQAAGQFGFVSGCYWGDDSSWKIQYLDLSRVSEGIIVRDDRFGYIEQMPNLTLKQSIDFWSYYYDPNDPHESDKQVTIACMKRFPLAKSSQESVTS